MRSKFMSELTTPEVEQYLQAGGKLAILPVGALEMHGPHQPLGTDTFIAKAFSLKLAELSNGLVLPEIYYTWAGSTDGFAGTVSIDPDLVRPTFEAIAVKVIKMGFRHFVVVNVHGPNQHIIVPFIRRFYEKFLIPALYINPWSPFCDATSSIFEGDYGKSKEASLVLGALHILAQPSLYSEQDMKYEDHSPPFVESFDNLAKLGGGAGLFMQDMRQHACPSKFVSKAKGIEYIEKQAQFAAPVLKNLDQYAEASRQQKNKGWWQSDNLSAASGK